MRKLLTICLLCKTAFYMLRISYMAIILVLKIQAG